MEHGPFYAVKVVPGDLGTCGGLRADEHAQVLREDGTAIEGLYATGNGAGRASAVPRPRRSSTRGAPVGGSRPPPIGCVGPSPIQESPVRILARSGIPRRRWPLAAILALALALAACGGDADGGTNGSDASEGTAADDPSDGGDAEAADEGNGDEAADDEAADEGNGDEAADDEAADDGDGQDPVAIDGCPVTSETVSDIVGSTLVAGDPQDTTGDGVTCAYLHETDLYPDAAVTVGNWDGTEESRDGLIATNVDRFGEPTDTPSDLGEHAFLWNEPDEQSTLIVFGAGRYYTTTVNGIDDVGQSRDIVASLYEAAP